MNIALVTGANKGIGLQLSRELGQRSFHVLMGARDKGRGMSAAQELRDESLSVEFVELDMEQPAHFRRVTSLIAERFGKLDVLINNAGVQIESDEWNVNTCTDISMEVLRRTMDINFFGMVELTQQLLPLLKAAPAARIVNVSSILGSLRMQATPGSNTWSTKTFAYNTSKAAVNSFTIHLAHALRDTAIKVNSAHPGWVKTDMGGKGASLSLEKGAYTPLKLALIDETGPTGSYMFEDKILDW